MSPSFAFTCGIVADSGQIGIGASNSTSLATGYKTNGDLFQRQRPAVKGIYCRHLSDGAKVFG